MWKSVLNCFRRAPAKRAASGGGAAATGYVVPKIVVDYLPAWVVKSAMAAGGLVCVGVLIWVPVYADDWSGWTPTSQQEVLMEPRPFGWTGTDAPGGRARRTVSALRAELLDSPTLLFPVTGAASQNYASASCPCASLPQNPATSSDRNTTGYDATPVPEPSSILLYLVGMGGMIIAAACGLMFDRLYRALRR